MIAYEITRTMQSLAHRCRRAQPQRPPPPAVPGRRERACFGNLRRSGFGGRVGLDLAARLRTLDAEARTAPSYQVHATVIFYRRNWPGYDATKAWGLRSSLVFFLTV
jgi:hypothetical protein